MRPTVGHGSSRRIECSLRGGIVTVRGDSMATRAEVVVRIRMIHRHRVVDIERGALVDRMPPGERVQVGGIVGIGAAGGVVLARVTKCLARVRPPQAYAVRGGQHLRQRQPGRVVAGAFILEVEIGWKRSLRWKWLDEMT